ncbi:uncharacterized protein MONOS_2146 [Monocercomonoides exilis]|uniref:uncharacterized protein n=1 Tax=Monocercomonoides exilis TaxID=2049356 RepID=UPI00355A4004|nr:hypothetical protein MONOS_2146 [Monocercomonoides exilis]|eukprot:MONOS_2146.1-p1 / transcript=MONOS_2146.1 / gene=MONOS_2146 / organism=Monocercomonoides_exilis_PA203 / gene_product=unspecified product / transcript_product=unspecified product / location=Mono_scaffold00042:123905-124138(-) / protein_length=78 / sequence_SO=supercontig / SO=protein_coding / is_pseudo=false
MEDDVRTVYALLMRFTPWSSVPMKLTLMMMKTGLLRLLVKWLSTIREKCGDKIITDMGSGGGAEARAWGLCAHIAGG